MKREPDYEKILSVLNGMTKQEKQDLFIDARRRAVKAQLKGKRMISFKTAHGYPREAVKVGTVWAVRDPKENYYVIQYLCQRALVQAVAEGTGVIIVL